MFNRRRAGFLFAIGGELTAISLGRRFVNASGKFCCHSKYEGTDFEELALDIGFHPVDQTDAGKLAREVGLSTTRDNGLVPNQKKRRDDAVGV